MMVMTTEPKITQAYIDEKRAYHKAALVELDILERHLKSIAPVFSVPMKLKLLASKGKVPVKRKLLLGIIASSGKGMTTRQVIDAAKEKGEHLKPENVSPKLSFYKGKEWLDLVDGVWSITAAGREALKE